jgi:hypothetical protein
VIHYLQNLAVVCALTPNVFKIITSVPGANLKTLEFTDTTPIGT